jgi:hypothetical protein
MVPVRGCDVVHYTQSLNGREIEREQSRVDDVVGTILGCALPFADQTKGRGRHSSAAVIFSHRDPISNGVWCYITLEYTQHFLIYV